jgi:hypothetical protein
MLKKIKERSKNIKERIGAFCTFAFVAILAWGGTASAAVTLPDMPVDFNDYATAGMTVVGTVLGAIAGIVVVVALTRMGLSKLASAFNGRA